MSSIKTPLAPAARADATEIDLQSHYFNQTSLLDQILDAVPSGVVILNQQRQIVYTNQPFLAFIGLQEKEKIIGMRPGEAIGCQYAFQTEGGCGTTEFCRTCGAVQAILGAQKGESEVRECRIIRATEGKFEALNLRVRAKPLFLNEEYTLFTVTDIADEKRRQVLERVFFHDLRNTAGIIHGAAESLQGAAAEDPVGQLLVHTSRKLVDEINAQQQLLAAENGRLTLNLQTVTSISLLEEVMNTYNSLALLHQCQIHLDPDAVNLLFKTDPTVLGRVLGNMVKNALEASQLGETVTIGCDRQAQSLCFWVHNPAFMPPHVQSQLFQRSFSTKGTHRGLGTYSMRLLSERYLQGHVGFESSQEDGTTFRATYPLLAPKHTLNGLGPVERNLLEDVMDTVSSRS